MKQAIMKQAMTKHSMINKRLRPLLQLATVCMALQAFTAHAQFYEVEMTVFTNSGHAHEQHWPANIKVEYPSRLTGLSTKPAEEIYPELVQPNHPAANPYLVPLLDQRFSKHGEDVRKLQQSGRHRILFSKTWLQKVEGAEYAQNIIIQGGGLESNVHELGGTVSFYLTPSPDNKPDSLHISTRLWQVTFGGNNGKPWPVPPSYAIGNTAPELLPVDNNVQIQRIALLNTSEIITPNTLHYIDHPLFGVLVEIRPYSAISLTE